MAERPAVPEAFASLVDLAAELTGGFVLFATDDFFAGKENLLRAAAPVFLPDEYTDKGKWMDGWESQRRRTPGHDHAVIRLGLPGRVHGFVIDTTHFKGNAPEACSVDVLEADPYLPLDKVLSHPAWRELVPRTNVRPDFPNVVMAPSPSGRVTHVRLHQYPDGGVARLRVYGEVLPEPRTFWRPGSLDLGAVENGGTIAAVSDQFFGPPSNLLLPGRGVNMGDGWETKRRRTPGSDWCVVKLGRRGVLDVLEVHTHFFKGNAPQHVFVEALDEATLGEARVAALLRSSETGRGAWEPFVDKHPLEQHRRHELEPTRRVPVTHLRVHIFPHGGVNRMRFYGRALDTEAERAKLAALHGLSDDEARTLFLSLCGARAFADQLLAARPFRSVRALFGVMEEAFWSLGEAALLEAYAAHPRLGTPKRPATQTDESARWSAREQAGTTGASDDVLDALAAKNELYFQKHGFIFICFATGKSADDMLAALEERLPRSTPDEIATAAREQWKITKRRLEVWLTSA